MTNPMPICTTVSESSEKRPFITVGAVVWILRLMVTSLVLMLLLVVACFFAAYFGIVNFVTGITGGLLVILYLILAAILSLFSCLALFEDDSYSPLMCKIVPPFLPFRILAFPFSRGRFNALAWFTGWIVLSVVPFGCFAVFGAEYRGSGDFLMFCITPVVFAYDYIALCLFVRAFFFADRLSKPKTLLLLLGLLAAGFIVSLIVSIIYVWNTTGFLRLPFYDQWFLLIPYPIWNGWFKEEFAPMQFLIALAGFVIILVFNGPFFVRRFRTTY